LSHLQISKLREQLKLQKKQIETEESDRKNQLHIMKNTYEQASSDKNRVIGLFESVVREQECELEELRKISDTRGEMFDSILRMFLEKKCIDLV